MPVLTQSEQRYVPQVHCVREVRVGIPPERRLEVEDFYRFILGLTPWPDPRQIPGGWGAGDPARGILFQFRHDPDVDPMRRRFVLAVNSLDAFESHLAQREWPYQRRRGWGVTDDVILVVDPIGHRVEVRQLRPL